MKSITEKQRMTLQHNEITEKIGRKQFKTKQKPPTINHTPPFQTCLIAFEGFIKSNDHQP